MEAAVRPLSCIRGVEVAPPLPSPLFILDDHTESQDILSRRGPARINKLNSLVNDLVKGSNSQAWHC